MSFFNTSSICMRFFPKRYYSQAVEKYNRAMRIINSATSQPLTLSEFRAYGISSLSDLNRYLSQKSEYGGYVKTEVSDQLIIIPFHNDFMNTWLKFKNPKVVEFYDRLYDYRKHAYHSREHFDKKRFDIEEDLQINNWTMPMVDKKMLEAPIFGCWDKPELLSRFLELQGFQTKRLCCHDGNEMRGHCFAVYFDGKYWRTTSTQFLLNYKCRDYQEFCNRVFSVVRNIPFFSSPRACSLVEYKAPSAGTTAHELVESIKNGILCCPSKTYTHEDADASQ